ncbi:MAG: glycosyltransferase [Bacilli bacterium]|nr:glycosyltransferase [Bacilli bacterium]
MKYKYKVCVYAICKNEEKFVDRWYESVKEADEIYVLDTGSDDNTVMKLKSHGINVICEKIVPWRFDVARNKSLELVPKDTDICVCTDLDEVFVPGWREQIEKLWSDDATRLRITYNWKLIDDKPVVSFYYEKIHKRDGYKWVHPVHEVLKYEYGNEKIVNASNIILNHYPDNTKSRSSYLPLLELSVKEDPLDDRNMHYLGREYMYYKKWNECIDTLIKHLNLKRATWSDERAASMRFIGRSYFNLGRIEESRMWYLKAIKEAPHLRDALVELAILEYNENNYLEVINLLTRALTIKEHPMTYINEVFSWDYTIDNLLSCCYYYLGIYDIALFYINRALKYDQNNQMLIDNQILIQNKVNNK